MSADPQQAEINRLRAELARCIGERDDALRLAGERRVALVALLEPYQRISDQTLRDAIRDKRVPAGLGKALPGEILLARRAIGGSRG